MFYLYHKIIISISFYHIIKTSHWLTMFANCFGAPNLCFSNQTKGDGWLLKGDGSCLIPFFLFSCQWLAKQKEFNKYFLSKWLTSEFLDISFLQTCQPLYLLELPGTAHLISLTLALMAAPQLQHCFSFQNPQNLCCSSKLPSIYWSTHNDGEN